jgi:hypothetical protein
LSQKIILHRQSPDLGTQPLHARAQLIGFLGGRGEILQGALEELCFPLRNLVGMHIELLGELGERVVAP